MHFAATATSGTIGRANLDGSGPNPSFLNNLLSHTFFKWPIFFLFLFFQLLFQYTLVNLLYIVILFLLFYL